MEIFLNEVPNKKNQSAFSEKLKSHAQRAIAQMGMRLGVY